MDAVGALLACRTAGEVIDRLPAIAQNAISQADAGVLYLLDAETGVLKAHSASGIQGPLDGMHLRVGEGVIGHAFRTGRAGSYAAEDSSVPALPGIVTPKGMLVMPLQRLGQLSGVLMLASSSAVFDQADVSLLQLLAEHAAMNLEQMRLLEQKAQQVTQLQQALLDAEERSKRNLIDGMLAGKHWPDFERSARALGIDPNTPMVCLWMDIDHFGNYLRSNALDEGSAPQLMQHLYKALNELVREHAHKGTVSLKDDELIVFLPATSEDNAAQKIAERFQAWLAQSYSGLSVSIAISRTVQGFDGLIDALDDLQRATALHQRNRRYGRIFFVDRLGVDRLLLQFPDARLLLEFATGVLGRIENDKSGEKDLLKTLGAYFENGRSVAGTAHVMHLHQNTVRYRLDRIRELAGSEDWLSIELAVRIYQLHKRL
jgi:sugar diacid utilization regulator